MDTMIFLPGSRQQYFRIAGLFLLRHYDLYHIKKHEHQTTGMIGFFQGDKSDLVGSHSQVLEVGIQILRNSIGNICIRIPMIQMHRDLVCPGRLTVFSESLS